MGPTALTDDGMLPLPVMIGLGLSGIAGSELQVWAGRRGVGRPPDEDPLLFDPVVISVWEAESDAQVRQLCNVMAQSWGYASSPGFDPTAATSSTKPTSRGP